MRRFRLWLAMKFLPDGLFVDKRPPLENLRHDWTQTSSSSWTMPGNWTITNGS